MAHSKKKSIFAKVFGTILTVLLLPFCGIIYLLMFIGLGVYSLWERGWEFVVDLWRQLNDPSYYRIGWIDGMCRSAEAGKGAECWNKGDYQGAVAHWRFAARLYSNYAMFRLAQCYEEGKGVEKDLSVAYEFYWLADLYHHPRAEEECKRLEHYAMTPRQYKAFETLVWARQPLG